MVFSSPIFLFLFLPALLAVYALTPRRLRNLLLLAASLLFYAWGEGPYTAVMLASIAGNYAAGLALEGVRGRPRARRVVVALAVAANLLLLGVFKYANFLVVNLNVALGLAGLPGITLGPVHLPIGISFFTFQALSYVVDLYRGQTQVQRNPADLALYVTLFPQLIAGPIVRYHDVAAQLRARRVTGADVAIGVRRFIVGLGKKVLIANTLALPADRIFALGPEALGPGVAWLGVVCYALQIYFDFSGYSDMALGLGRLFGFRFLENFNYPYIATSLREFWRRWHISLSSWFRDYLYIPLGGNRGSPWRTGLNLVTVFFLCGLWHGAQWTFVVWGLLHGAFLMAERLGLELWLRRRPRALQHAYVLLVLALTWVCFRAETFTGALQFLVALGGAKGQAAHTAAMHLNPVVWLALVAGIIGATPLAARLHAAHRAEGGWAYHGTAAIGLLAVLALSAMSLASGTYNPFIYFRF